MSNKYNLWVGAGEEESECVSVVLVAAVLGFVLCFAVTLCLVSFQGHIGCPLTEMKGC